MTSVDISLRFALHEQLLCDSLRSSPTLLVANTARRRRNTEKENEGGNTLPVFEEEGGSGGGIGLGYAKWAGKHYSVMKQVSLIEFRWAL